VDELELVDTALELVDIELEVVATTDDELLVLTGEEVETAEVLGTLVDGADVEL